MRRAAKEEKYKQLLKRVCKEEKILVLAGLCFRHFYNYIFSLSLFKKEGVFETGAHIDDICNRMQDNLQTATKSARTHSKSHILYAYVMWRIYRVIKGFDDPMDLEITYGSYTDKYAGKHIGKIRRFIELNPLFNGFNMGDAETLIRSRAIIKKNDGTTVIVEIKVLPMGILGFKRGDHPDVLILDDILRDERKQKLDIAMIEKITDIVKEEILSMPKENRGVLHISGTPQDKSDVFSYLETDGGFNYKEYPAILDWKRKIILWPEMYTWKALMLKRKRMGLKAFNKEWMCSPARSEEGYFKEEEIQEVENSSRENLLDYLEADEGHIRKVLEDMDGETFAGLDIGKKRHPSHLTIYLFEEFDITEEVNGREVVTGQFYKYTNIGEIWMDHWQYLKQLNYCNKVCRVFGLGKLMYDNTRGEFEGFAEEGRLEPAMEGVVMSRSIQQEDAAHFDKLVNWKVKDEEDDEFQPIEILANGRTRRQICSVDNDLKAVETKEGHGDSFWSTCLALRGIRTGSVNFRSI